MPTRQTTHNRLKSFLLGAISSSFITITIAFWCIPLWLVGIIRLALPWQRWRRFHLRIMHRIVDLWTSGNAAMLRACKIARFHTQGMEGLRPDSWYMLIPNHRTWADIIVLQCLFSRRIPVLKFFLKRQLIWVPFVGLACYALEFPFVSRHSREYLAKHPEKRNDDLVVTRNACERYRALPTSILSFLEGTRFSEEKRRTLQSPYQQLLPPKLGGLALVLAEMGSELDALLDVTIIYPRPNTSFWDFLCGRTRDIRIMIREIPIPPEICTGNYLEDQEFRALFRDWVAGWWRAKDELIIAHTKTIP